MNQSPVPVEDLPFVEGVLNYLGPMAEKPFSYVYEPPAGVARTNAVYDPRRLPVYSARRHIAGLSLDREGFAVVAGRSAMRDFYDEAELRRVYYPECERIVAAAIGAERVIVFDHTTRRRQPQTADRTKGAPRQPVMRVHNDYTLQSGPQRVRDLMGEEAEALLGRRYAFINLWRPIRGPVKDSPLALCDAQSVAFADFVGSDQVYPDRKGETYVVTYNPAHRWFYLPEMQTDEALLIKCYDSETDVARFVPHSAFADPTTPADAPARESIEIRTIAFFN